MKIRPAILSDVPAVLPMVAKICALHESWDAAKYGFLPNPALRYERWLMKLANSDRAIFLVADTETTDNPKTLILAGFLVATVEGEIPIYRLKEYGFIHDIWVEPEYRHAGIARQMVKQTIELFHQMGVKQIRLDTAVPNEAARRLFSSCGFRTSTIEMLVELE
ncbi:MAG TPA: GNAT family N-acetyltransferase [Leptolyngbyaceae cyanobacterium]